MPIDPTASSKRKGPKPRDLQGNILPEHMALADIPRGTGRQNRMVTSVRVPNAHRGTFHPEYVGVINNYPATLEKYEANRQNGRNSFAAYHARMGHTPNRHGVPDGWGGKTKLLKKIRSNATLEAKEIIKTMIENKIVPEGIDPKAHDALEFAIGVVRAKNPENQQPAYAVRDHLAACRVVLEYTHTKPASTSNVNIGTAEAFLEALAGRTKE